MADVQWARVGLVFFGLDGEGDPKPYSGTSIFHTGQVFRTLPPQQTQHNSL